MRYEVDESDGLIAIRVPEGATDEQLDSESLYEQVEQHLTSGPDRWLVLHDLRRTLRSSVRRRRFTGWVRDHEALIKARIRAYAIVASSAPLQGMITAVLWVVDPPIDWRAFSDPLEAERWLRSLSFP